MSTNVLFGQLHVNILDGVLAREVCLTAKVVFPFIAMLVDGVDAVSLPVLEFGNIDVTVILELAAETELEPEIDTMSSPKHSISAAAEPSEPC